MGYVTRRYSKLVAITLLCALIAVAVAARTFRGATPPLGGSPDLVTVATVAGRAGVPGSADGSRGQARFHGPEGIACDAHGNLYIADTDNSTIRKISTAGVVTTLAGRAGLRGSVDGPGASARFDVPYGIACDAVGNLYVTDSLEDTVRKITSAGLVTTLAGEPGSSGSTDGRGAAARFDGPEGIACDTHGNVYVADSLNDTIRKIAPGGQVSTVAGEAGKTGSDNDRGKAARFSGPQGIVCDAHGTLYVTDNNNQTVRKITPFGWVSTLAGDADSVGSSNGIGTAARFNGPSGIACDARGDLYVADTFNQTIRRITPAGAVTTLAGAVRLTGSADGSGAAARFYQPVGVACGPRALYVTDYMNCTVRSVVWSK